MINDGISPVIRTRDMTAAFPVPLLDVCPCFSLPSFAIILEVSRLPCSRTVFLSEVAFLAFLYSYALAPVLSPLPSGHQKSQVCVLLGSPSLSAMKKSSTLDVPES